MSAVLVRPDSARWLYVLGHGAGAGMRHPFMERIAAELAQRDVATFRYQFPYMEAGRRRPDHGPILMATVRSAIGTSMTLAGGLPVVAGGKSMGGRMTSMAAAHEKIPGVRSLVFLGFPLHPGGKPGTERSEHLFEVDLPMLFLQGNRDRLADLELLRPVCRRLGSQTELRIVDGGDHSFQVLKRSGRIEDEVMAEIADGVREWCEVVCG